ncbi:S-adenosyl-L-methionine-dependent methyltransferase [Mycena crocata]|nr:S-adenosyl-L-methionine-dependent methyltransferase [Mycena crocata]
MPPRKSAWEVSFPEEAAAGLADLQISQPPPGPQTLKRKASEREDSELQRTVKRSQNLIAGNYVPPRRYITETAEYRAPGEDPDNDQKPVRILSNFCIFNPSLDNQFVLLDTLESNDQNRQFAAAGVVLLADEDDEDYGQEDGADAAEDSSDGDHVRLDNIGLCTFDYLTANAPIYIKTLFAFYELRGPSTRYKRHFLSFTAPRLTARRVLMEAGGSNLSHGATKEDLVEAWPHIRDFLEDCGDAHLKRSPLIQKLMAEQGNGPRRGTPRRVHQPPRAAGFLGSADLALLKAENQNPTTVTPLIAQLAEGFFEETLSVIGARPVQPNKADVEKHKANALRSLKSCVARARFQQINPANISFGGERWKYGHVKEATINGDVYEAGNFVCIPKGEYRGVQAPPMVQISDVPDDALLADYFWFARILYFHADNMKVHVQWLAHGSQIALNEMAHPLELFLTLTCDDIHIRTISGKVEVEYPKDALPKQIVGVAGPIGEGQGYRPKQGKYFFRFVYNESDASFTSVDEAEMNDKYNQPPPNNCVPCARTDMYNLNADWSVIEEDSVEYGSVVAGVSYQGHNYHYHDFFLYNNNTPPGPAHIGYIKRILRDRRGGSGPPKIIFFAVGRVSTILKGEFSEDIHDVYPERHLFLTDAESSVLVNELIRPVQVYSYQFFEGPNELKRWVDYSPDHFYVSYRLPSLDADSWAQRVEVPASLPVCEFKSCRSEMYRWDLREEEFQAQLESDHQCLDLFGGTGAFSQAVAEGSRGCLKPTHVIEITPSAARTVQQNSNVVTYCQDANTVLRYCVKSHAGHDVEVPFQLFDDKKEPLPPPIRPGRMRAVFAGLPCQSHSGLNMYRKAEDRKSNLILTALSYVDFFKPDFFFLENVPGFLKYNLLAEQKGRHRVEGGIEMGGLKLVLRSLLEMRYQVRYALLQAGNYGAPQNRIRFFLVAARHGLPLPAMPQPTHDFEVVNQLKMRLPYHNKPQVVPIRTTRGTMLHASVSIDDAIGDLPQFDWKHPDPQNAAVSLRRLLRQRAQQRIPVHECRRDKTHSGYEGNDFEYKHAPRTSYQRQARELPTQDIQHYTRCLLPKTVERVVTIPLEPGADFRSLPDNLAEWQFHNPTSAVGRNRYRGGLYGRLAGTGYFPTTVTNMHPTAKQCKVLHPDSLRMVTVRELARSQGFPDWFVFRSINNNVVTLHRQIGNAVPWQVSRALGRELRTVLFKKWKAENKLEPSGAVPAEDTAS